MPINPLIPLGVQVPNIGGAVNSFADSILEQRRASRIEDIETERNAIARRREQRDEAKARREEEVAAQRQSQVDWTRTMLRIKPHLGSGNTAAVASELEQRSARLRAEGRDSSHTDELLRMVRENPQAALADVDNEIQIAQQFDLIKEASLPKAPTTREVKRGNETITEQFDPATRTFVEVGRAPTHKPDTMSPEREAQERRLIAARASVERGTQRERDVSSLMGRGLSRSDAEDVAAGRVRLTAPDQFGNVWLVNVVTGERRQTTGPGEAARTVAAPDDEPAQIPSREVSGGRPLATAVEQGTGPVANIQASISNVVGPFVSGAMFPETTRSREQLRIFAQTAKTALVNNPKFPVAEQQIVQKLLPNPDQFFNDPDAAREDLKELRDFLARTKGVKARELSAGRITSDRRGELADQISRIDEVLSLMGDVDAGQEVTATNPQTGERVRFNRQSGQWEPVR